MQTIKGFSYGPYMVVGYPFRFRNIQPNKSLWALLKTQTTHADKVLEFTRLNQDDRTN